MRPLTCLTIVALNIVALTGAALTGAAHAGVPAYVTAAVNNPARPAADRADDAVRKPAATLAFIAAKPGDTVVDMLPGRGYFTQLFCGVVGPAGHVVQLDFVRPTSGPGAVHKGDPVPPAPICANVSRITVPITAIALPQPADVILTSRNYHDFHNIPAVTDVVALDRQIFAALKPGGLFIVLDHADADGAGITHTSTLHRIDPAAVKQEVTAAGFTFVSRSAALHNAADDHSRPIFDPAVKGHTDQFILKFRRPK